MLYGCDGAWWRKAQGAAGFKGLKLSADRATCARLAEVHHVAVAEGCDDIITEVPGHVGAGGNSGFQALNLAVQFGARTIILVGFDMHIGAGVHWHGKHPPGLNNPGPATVARWRAKLDAQAARVAALGVTVLNASPGSALTAYPKMTLEEALHVVPSQR